LKIISLGGFFVEVDDKERLGRLDILATVVFLALDASIPTGEFNS